MILEAKKLIKLKAISYRRMRELGLEYRYVALYLQKRLSKKEMFEKLNTAIRQYARRQLAWFKRNKAAVNSKSNFYETDTIKRVLQSFKEELNNIIMYISKHSNHRLSQFSNNS